MSGPPKPPIREALETVQELRERLGLFSFRNEAGRIGSGVETGSLPALDLRPGIIVEWLVTRPGAGALTSTLQILSRCLGGRGAWVVVDPVRESYVPAISGWGLDPTRTLLLHPATVQETCWAIEQCLRCPGVAATWACIEQRLSPTVLRRWKRAAEVGGGVGLLFRPDAPDGSPRGPTCVCASRPYREAGVTPDGSRSTYYIAGAASEAAPRYGRSTMPRVMCVWFPRWPIQRLRSERPELRRSELVLFAGGAQRPIITECTPKAERHGVRIGQPLAEARALLPRAVYLPADDVADSGALRLLALDAQRFHPWSVSRTALNRRRCSPPSTVARTLGRGTSISSGCSHLLARPGLSHPACSDRLAGSGLGARAHHTFLGRTGWRRGAGLVELAGRGAAVAGCRARAAARPGIVQDWRCDPAPSRDAGQPVRHRLTATAGPGAGPAPRVVRLRAIE